MCRFSRSGLRDSQQSDGAAEPVRGYRYAYTDLYAHSDLYSTPPYSHSDVNGHANRHTDHHTRSARRLTDSDIITNAISDTSDVYGNATTAADESSTVAYRPAADFNGHTNTRTNS